MPAPSRARAPIPDRVTDYVVQHIRENALRTGDPLPSEVRTATELGVSRGLVREAFRSLQTAGIIQKGNGRSPTVGAVSSDFLVRLMEHALSTQQVSFEQVLDVRQALEVRSAELAAVRRTAEELRTLREALRGMKRVGASAEEFVQHDLEFHRVLQLASGNPLLQILGGAIHESARQTMFAGLLTRSRRKDILEIVRTHALIVDAVEARSASAAGACMRRHFLQALKAYRNAQQRFDL